MAELRSPFGGAVINVPDGMVDRYVTGGWVKVEPEKPVRRRKTAEPDESK